MVRLRAKVTERLAGRGQFKRTGRKKQACTNLEAIYMSAGIPHLPSAGILLKHEAMLNYVWSSLLITGIIAGALFGRLEVMVSSVFETCKTVVLGIALPLAGIMMLWLGILRVMEKCGLMEVVARLLSPLLRRIFPDVPPGHPAMGAITMNIASNMLGLGNSSTPLGLKAMQHLQELNPHKQTASNAMCMFLALNTAGFAILPMTSINYLSAAGVKNPQIIIAPAIIASLLATITGVLAAKFFQRLPMFRITPDDASVAESGDANPVTPKTFRLTPLRTACIAIAAIAFALGALLEFMPEKREDILRVTGMRTLLDSAAAKKKAADERKTELKAESAAASTSTAVVEEEVPWWRQGLLGVSAIAVPAILLVVVLWGLARGVPVYEEMVEGAKEGFGVATRIMPFLVVMLAALTLFRESGALMLLEYALRPTLALIGMPVELFPLAVMRPLSGSGSAGLLNEVILNPASSDFLRYTAAVLFGSTETTFYVLAVYFGSVSIRRTRHALAAGLCADTVGMSAAIFLGWLLFATA
jgi:spore maturation protein SpmA